MVDLEQNMFFFLTDISGYTSFMLATKKEVSHGMVIITKLMESLIKEVALPMVISKLEGDAIFFYMLEEKIPKKMRENRLVIGQKLNAFFTAFALKMQELQESNICPCGACANMTALSIKMIVHYGKATISKVGTFEELSGTDVILAHRLLKNSIEENRYLLLTEPAFKQVLLPDSGTVSKKEEIYEDVGNIPVYIYHPPLQAVEADYSGKKYRVKNFLPRMFAPLFLGIKGKKKDQFKHL